MATKRKAKSKGKASLRGLLAVLSADEIAARLGVAPSTVRTWKTRDIPKGRKAQLSSIVIDDQTRIRAATKKIARDARREGKIEKPGDAPGFNVKKKQETRRYKGVVENTRLRRGMLVTEANEESIVHAIMQKAKKIKRSAKKGKFFVTLGLVEFGQPQGSGGKRIKQISRGPLGGYSAYQTFASTSPDYGTGAPRGARDLAGLEAQVRTLVGRLHGDKRAASLIDNFTVKRYRKKTKTEVEAWRTNRGK